MQRFQVSLVLFSMFITRQFTWSVRSMGEPERVCAAIHPRVGPQLQLCRRLSGHASSSTVTSDRHARRHSDGVLERLSVLFLCEMVKTQHICYQKQKKQAFENDIV